MAAGALLVKEAGGLLTDFTGEGDFMAGDVLAATPKLLPALLRELDPANKTTF
jgi:myo-inositol-1(or 4)-monophosphatase